MFSCIFAVFLSPIWEGLKTGDTRIANETLLKLPKANACFSCISAIFWWWKSPIWEGLKTGETRIAKETLSKVPNDNACFLKNANTNFIINCEIAPEKPPCSPFAKSWRGGPGPPRLRGARGRPSARARALSNYSRKLRNINFLLGQLRNLNFLLGQSYFRSRQKLFSFSSLASVQKLK